MNANTTGELGLPIDGMEGIAGEVWLTSPCNQ
jgi:hypothetical protein